MSENGRHKACNACRERKIKCDGGQQKCGRCTRCAVQCFYAPPSKRYSKADFASVLETLNNRLLQAEAAAATAQNGLRQPLLPTTSPSLSSMWASFAPLSTPSDSAFMGMDYMNGQNNFPTARDFSLPDMSPNDVGNGGDFMFSTHEATERLSGIGNFGTSAMISPELSPPRTINKEFDFSIGVNDNYTPARGHTRTDSGLTSEGGTHLGRTLPSPGSSNPSTTMTLTSDRERRRTQNGQPRDENAAEDRRPGSRDNIAGLDQPESSATACSAPVPARAQTAAKPGRDFASKGTSRRQETFSLKDNGISDRSSDSRHTTSENTRGPRQISQQTSESARTSASYDYSPTHGNDDLQDGSDNYEYEAQYSAVSSPTVPSKRRRLQGGSSEQRRPGTNDGNRNEGDFDFDLEMSRRSSISSRANNPRNSGTSAQRAQSQRESSIRPRIERRSSGDTYLPSPNLSKPPTPCSSSMRRSIGNGTAFNGLVKLQGRENYLEWARAIRAAARKEGVWDILIGTCGPPRPINSNASLCEQHEHQDDIVYWTNKVELALGGLEGSLEDHIQASVDGIECPRAMWLKLERDYKPSESRDLYNLIQRLDNISLTTCGNVERLASELRQIQDRMHYLKKSESLPGWYFAFRFLHSLGPDYEDFITRILVEAHKDQEREVNFEQIVSQAITEQRRHR